MEFYEELEALNQQLEECNGKNDCEECGNTSCPVLEYMINE